VAWRLVTVSLLFPRIANKYRVEGLVSDEESVRTLATTLFIQATRSMKK
jgi:hypothetical protein